VVALLRSGAVSSRSGPTKPHAARKAAGRVRVDVYLSKTVAGQLDALAREWEMTRTGAIDWALRIAHFELTRPGRSDAAKR
jgi:hypothetical protein